MTIELGDLMTSGIYAIHNLISDKVYVGQAVLFSRRWSYHISKLTQNQHHCKHLQAAWNRYGAENFEFLVLQEIHPVVEELTRAEQAWMDHYAVESRLYNTAPAAGSVLGSRWKVKTPRSPEHRQKISEARKGTKQSEETKAKRKLFRHTLESRLKISEAGKNRAPISEETRVRQSEASKGKPKSAEHKAKIAASHTGKPKSAEHKAKISVSNLGKKQSEETKAKKSAAMKGKPGSRKGKTNSPEHNQRVSEAKKGKPSPHKGRIQTADHVAKRIAACAGRKMSPEAIAQRQATRALNKVKKQEAASQIP
jgi:group I intron endonuclease